ncbi:MAG TPA: SIS domain-containing protein [Conexibacter sp.]|jgi:D-sedoheptulose 7-phosphate isomerase|nr:SIS domain-containing protein [Conexibacter sp.]
MTALRDPAARIDALLAARLDAGERFFAAEAERLARLCHRMAERFAAGGRLLALGRSPAARSDAHHVAVEFVHPVIVGKRALPALALTAEGGSLARQVELLAAPGDLAIAFEAGDPEMAAALALAGERGCLTIATGDAPGDLVHAGAEWAFAPEVADPFVRQELIETLYHVLWELVHVFFEHRGLLAGRSVEARSDAGAASFLYPFLDEREDDLDAVLDDVRRSILMKSAEIGALRTQTLTDNTAALRDAATRLRERLDAGGTLLALGNGGSATDAMDAVADLREPPPQWPARRALDLTEDTAVLTAVANDVGVEAIFARQAIAHGRAGDALLTFSTSGSSTNVLAALAEARRRELLSVACVGYDGGRIVAEGLADIAIVTRSEHIPRIQEAQASAWHVLRELLEVEA